MFPNGKNHFPVCLNFSCKMVTRNFLKGVDTCVEDGEVFALLDRVRNVRDHVLADVQL